MKDYIKLFLSENSKKIQKFTFISFTDDNLLKLN